MSRAFVREDAGDDEPEPRLSLPPRDHPSYPAAAALALLDAAYAGKTSAGEAATGLVDHDPYNARSVLRLMGALDAAGCRVEALRHAHLYEERLRAAP